jgi:hypothetical protein
MPPSFSTTGKKKGKQKFSSAAAKQQHMSLDQEWAMLKKKHGVAEEERKRARAMNAEPLRYNIAAPAQRSTAHIPSRGDGIGNATLAPQKVYSGSEMIGVGQLHKSNAIPIFKQADAVDLANMRR